jgi:ribonuclease HI
MSDSTRVVIHTDGGARGNPGPAAYAYVIERPGAPDIEVKAYLGRTTNNVAEYTGLVKALEHARELGVREVVVHSDSELMVKQLNGAYKVKNAGLLPLYRQADELRRAFDSVHVRHVYREQNTRADRLCNEALDDPRSAQPRTPEAPAVVAPPARRADVRQRAIALLEDAAARWADADPAAPQVAEVWDRLWEMLRQEGLIGKAEGGTRPTPGALP